jgi:TonB family protein
LLRAAADGDANLVRALLAQGTNVDSTNRAGQTALMLAAGFKRREVVQVLVSAGANLELQDDLGLTATDWAKNDGELLELFIQKPADKNQVDQTPTPTVPAEDPKPVPVSPRVVQPPSVEPKLKGLAGAILRDHKPRLEEHVQPLTTVAAPAPIAQQEPETPPQISGPDLPAPAVEAARLEPEPAAPIINPVLETRAVEEVRVTHQEIETPLVNHQTEQSITLPEDETLDKPRRDFTEDTAAAPRSSRAPRSRIFDLSAPYENAKPLSKVEVSLPESKPRSRVILWALLVFLLAGVGIGAYLLTMRLLTRQTTTAVEVKPKAEAPPTLPKTKSPPILSGDIVGAELHLPDAKYPTEAQGQSGTVQVAVQVSQKGIVFAAKAMDGEEIFRPAAEKAAKGSAFLPDKLPDAKVVEGTITYTFAPAPTSSDRPTPVGVTAVAGGPLSGAELELVQPEYSAKAKNSGAGGEFTVVIRVNRAGHVMSWRTLDGDTRLRDAAVKAARRSTFSPDKLPGTGEVVGTITYTFN